jgi:hypothetical protein
MQPPRLTRDVCALGVAWICALSILVVAITAAAKWPGFDFVIKTDEDEAERQFAKAVAAEGSGIPAATLAVLTSKLQAALKKRAEKNSTGSAAESEIESAAKFYETNKFRLPRLFPREDFFAGNAGQTVPYEIWIVDSIGGSEITRYSHDTCKDYDLYQNRGYIRVGLVALTGESAARIHRSVAHELNHAIQFHSPFASGCASSKWLREATAEGAGLLSTYKNFGGATKIGDIIANQVRSYSTAFRPTVSQAGGKNRLWDLGYDTGQFFFWAGLRYGGAGYLRSLYENPITKKDDETEVQAAKKDIKWIDEGMKSAEQVKTGLDFLFPQFVADYGSWREKFFTDKAVKSQDDWLTHVFGGGCEHVPLTIGNPFRSRTITLEPISAKCVIVDIDSGFPAFLALDAFAYIKGEDQFQRLDSIHLSTILRADAAGTVDPCEANSRSAKARTWPVCVVKPYLYERAGTHPNLGDAAMLTRSYDEASELIEPNTLASVAKGTEYVRVWHPQDHIYDQPGMRMVFALSNVAPTATSTHAETIEFVVGVRSTKLASNSRNLGIPQLIDPRAVPAGIGALAQQLIAQAGGGRDAGAAAVGAALADFEMGYAEYGITSHVELPGPHMVAINIPVEGAVGGIPGIPGASGYTLMLRDLPPLGETGIAKAIITYGEQTILAVAGTCDDRKEYVDAKILQSGIEGVRVSISTPMSAVDILNPAAGCIPWQSFDAEMTVPLGWPFDGATTPHHVVTPGVHAYVERYLGWLAEQGIPAPSIGPFPGWQPEIPVATPPAGGGGGGGGGGATAAGGQIACDCSCPALNALLASLDGMTKADKAALQPADITKMSTCVQSCMSELMACKMAEQN